MTFQYAQPTEDQKQAMQHFRDEYEKLSTEIKNMQEISPNRGFALALTKLEESAMWLNKALTNNC
jgi:hypothetical protein